MFEAGKQNIGTFTLTGSTLTIELAYGVRSLALKLVSGTVTYEGSMKLGALSSNAFTLDDTPVTISDDQAIDGLTIDASAGSVLLLTRS